MERLTDEQILRLKEEVERLKKEMVQEKEKQMSVIMRIFKQALQKYGD